MEVARKDETLCVGRGGIENVGIMGEHEVEIGRLLGPGNTRRQAVCVFVGLVGLKAGDGDRGRTAPEGAPIP
jgi:hypothetical protein